MHRRSLAHLREKNVGVLDSLVGLEVKIHDDVTAGSLGGEP